MGKRRNKKGWKRSAVIAMAFLMAFSTSPYLSSTAYAEGEEIVGNNDPELVTTTDTINNTDGSTTTIVTESLGDEILSIKETTVSADGTETREVQKGGDGAIWNITTTKTDAGGNVLWTTNEWGYLDAEDHNVWYKVTRDADNNGLGSEQIVTDAEGKMISKEVTEEHADGSHTTVLTEYDDDGNKCGSTEQTFDADGFLTKEVLKDEEDVPYETTIATTGQDGEGNLVFGRKTYDADSQLEKEVIMILSPDMRKATTIVKDGEGNVEQVVRGESRSGEDGKIVKSTVEEDGEGNILRSEELYYTQDGELTGKKTSFSIDYVDGTKSWITTEEDGNGETVRYSETMTDSEGTVIEEYVDLYHEDGTHTHIETKLDDDGNKIGSEEAVYNKDGMAFKIVIKDADDNVTETMTMQQDRDAQGNYVYTNATYDGNGQKTEVSVITLAPDLSKIESVIMDGDGNLVEIIRQNKDGENRFLSSVNLEDGIRLEVQGMNAEIAKEACTPDELTEYEGGETLTLRFVATDANETVTPEEEEAVKNALLAKGLAFQKIQYFDFSLYQFVGMGSEKKVENTGSYPLVITLNVPAQMQSTNPNVTRMFYVVRMHDGVATVMSYTADNNITFVSDEFSVYALTYVDYDYVLGSGSETALVETDVTAQTTGAVISPKTGEETNAWIWIVFAGVFGGAAVVCHGRRRRYENR